MRLGCPSWRPVPRMQLMSSRPSWPWRQKSRTGDKANLCTVFAHNLQQGCTSNLLLNKEVVVGRMTQEEHGGKAASTWGIIFSDQFFWSQEYSCSQRKQRANCCEAHHVESKWIWVWHKTLLQDGKPACYEQARGQYHSPWWGQACQSRQVRLLLSSWRSCRFMYHIPFGLILHTCSPTSLIYHLWLPRYAA